MFPDQFSRSKEYNYWSKIKQRTILMGQNALEYDEERAEQIEQINKWIVEQIKPKNITEEEKAIEKNYEELCILLSKHTNLRVKKMTVFEFYTMLALIKQKKIQ